MNLLLADRSIRYPIGIIEDFYLILTSLFFDVDKDVEVPLILDRSFLATSQALIDVSNGKMTFRIDDEEVDFALSASMKHSFDSGNSCFHVDATNLIIYDYVQ